MSNINEINNPQASATPPFSSVLKQALLSFGLDLQVSCPAIVLAYDYVSQTATVQPVFQKSYINGTTSTPPKVYGVPIGFLRAGNAFIHLPVQPGDTVQLVFSDRSLDKWKQNGSVGTPDDLRNHHLSDCWAYPGAYSLNNPAKVNNGNDLIISNAPLEIRIKPGGKIQIMNLKAGKEVIQILVNALGYMASGQVDGLLQSVADLSTFLASG